MNRSFVIKGNICYSKNQKELNIVDGGYLVCVDGISKGVFEMLPEEYRELPLEDCGDKLIIPGLVDLHVHAPQFTYRGLGMDMELLDWLETNTFPEEARYADLSYADRAYDLFVQDVLKGPNTRACIFATVHVPATELLMDKLEASGLNTYVGKVNMDRNCPDYLREKDAAVSAEDTRRWIEETKEKYDHTKPMLTPRFIPSCTDELMNMLGDIQKEYQIPVQSHLSENRKEIAWVQELCPESRFYGDAYDQAGLFGGENCPTLMAHCVHSSDEEIQMMKENGVYVVHCPQSNTNVSSGMAPIRRYLKEGLHVGLGSDVAGGSEISIFRAMVDAIQVSKLRACCVDSSLEQLTVEEAFYLGTLGGGSFFGKVGSFEDGYEFDAVVLDDTNIPTTLELNTKQRLERLIYFSDDRNVVGKYVNGRKLF